MQGHWGCHGHLWRLGPDLGQVMQRRGTLGYTSVDCSMQLPHGLLASLYPSSDPTLQTPLDWDVGIATSVPPAQLGACLCRLYCRWSDNSSA